MLLRYDPATNLYYELRPTGWYTFSRVRLEKGLRAKLAIELRRIGLKAKRKDKSGYQPLLVDAFALLRQVSAMEPEERLPLDPSRTYL